jgi:hypothetical protein
MSFNKEIDTEAILYKKDISELKREITEISNNVAKVNVKINNLTVEKER